MYQLFTGLHVALYLGCKTRGGLAMKYTIASFRESRELLVEVCIYGWHIGKFTNAS